MPLSAPYPSLPDDRLVSLLLRNDKEAIVYCFYQKFMPTFQYHLFKLGVEKKQMDDMVDEFYLYLQENGWRRLQTFNGSVSLSTWISVVSYRFFKNYKHTKIESNGVVTIDDKWEQRAGDWVQTVDAGIAVDVENAMAEIRNERDRDIARQLLVEDREPQEVAKSMDVSVDYLYTIKNRVVKRLRESLKAYGINGKR
jgi:DNA-directed RNA polymerase specialized sigma24 family protein